MSLSTRCFFEEAIEELRGVAYRLMSNERVDHTLSATALVHESFVRMSNSDGTPSAWDSRGHFFAAVSETMRRVLVDHARAKATVKRKGQRQLLELDELGSTGDWDWNDLLEVNDCLDLLADQDPEAAQFVKLRLFAGLSIVAAGRELGLSKWSSYQMWTFVQSWFAAQTC